MRKVNRWWFETFLTYTPIPGEMIQFDDHIFQMGCFNHQPVKTSSETIRQFDGTKLDLNICETRGPGGLGNDSQFGLRIFFQMGWTKTTN